MFRFGFLLTLLLILVLRFPSSIQSQELLLQKRHVQPNDIQFYNKGSRSSLSYLYQKRDEMFTIQLKKKSKKKNKNKKFKSHTHMYGTDEEDDHLRHYIVKKKDKIGTTTITTETTEYPAKELQQIGKSKDGWQLNLGVYLDKAEGRDGKGGGDSSSCDSDSDGKKKFFMFSDDTKEGIKELVSDEGLVRMVANGENNLFYDQLHRNNNSTGNFTEIGLNLKTDIGESSSKILGYGVLQLCIWILCSLM
ncbi:putative GPI-anchored protein 19 [Candida viswanathii]|uniref:Putative GPI-anchored protein 19 n=1 Tax=Candida viswanathii TaxID=5486 RepID=A0A367XND0_9ASCO|nr:putative GPI-anchored protein 19 [Candida viswanathii]